MLDHQSLKIQKLDQIKNKRVLIKYNNKIKKITNKNRLGKSNNLHKQKRGSVLDNYICQQIAFSETFNTIKNYIFFNIITKQGHKTFYKHQYIIVKKNNGIAIQTTSSYNSNSRDQGIYRPNNLLESLKINLKGLSVTKPSSSPLKIWFILNFIENKINQIFDLNYNLNTKYSLLNKKNAKDQDYILISKDTINIVKFFPKGTDKIDLRPSIFIFENSSYFNECLTDFFYGSFKLKMSLLIDFSYKKKFIPPPWSINYCCQDDFQILKQSKVFYLHNVKDKEFENHIKKLVYYREPVNIEMGRYYDLANLNKLFGYETGYYGLYYNEFQKLAPNFLVYVNSKVDVSDGSYGNYTSPTFNKSNIHILNAIGLAFDNISQPDYQFYKKIYDTGNIDYLNQLIKTFYKNLFKLIFESSLAIESTRPIIVMSLVGANNFAKLWFVRSINGLQEIWAQSFCEVYQEYKDRLIVLFMGAAGNVALQLISNQFNEIVDIGFFPANLEDARIKNNLAKTFFVNAWDCWSLPGNGNKADGSLDGRLGSRTNIAFAGTTLTNPFMEFIQLES